MAEIIWTFQALEDLSNIAEYLAKNSESYASRIVNLILAKVDLLASFPILGRIVPESNITSIRELVIKNYRVIYSIQDKDVISILVIRHSSRPLGDIPLA